MKKCFFLLMFLMMMCADSIAKSITDNIYTYYDAARNKYVLKGDKLEYVPTNSRESSSGTYNGGNYENIVLTHKEYQALERLFKNALADKKAQTTKNIKPNAAVEITSENKMVIFLLKSTSAINKSLNNFLKQLINKIRR